MTIDKEKIRESIDYCIYHKQHLILKPEVVLSLLDELDKAEKERDELHAALEQFATWGRMQHKAKAVTPLTDDGDALRLAVSLKLDVKFSKYPSGVRYVSAQQLWHPNDSMYYDDGVALGDDPYAATRRAIVRAAAEIRKELK